MAVLIWTCSAALLIVAFATTKPREQAHQCSTIGLPCFHASHLPCCPGLTCIHASGVRQCSSLNAWASTCIEAGQPCDPSQRDDCCKDPIGGQLQCVDMGMGTGPQCISGLSGTTGNSIQQSVASSACIKLGQPCNPSEQDLCCKDPGGGQLQCVDMGMGTGPQCISGLSGTAGNSSQQSVASSACIKSGEPCNPSQPDLCCQDPAGGQLQCVDMGMGTGPQCISGLSGTTGNSVQQSVASSACIKSGQPCNPSQQDLCCQNPAGGQLQCQDMGDGHGPCCISGLSGTAGKSSRQSVASSACIKSGQPCNPSQHNLCCKDPAGGQLQCVDMGMGTGPQCISGLSGKTENTIQ